MRTFVGGNMIANDRYVIIGLNPYEESYIEMGEKRCVEDVMRLVRDEEIMVLRGPPIYDHIDVLAMPGEGKLIYVFDPVKTKKLLEEKRINTEEDMGLIKPYMDVSPALMDFFKSRGLTVRPLPFWVTSYNGIPAMLSYPNSLQEDDAIYTLGVSERAENQRLRDIGEVLDDWFYKIFSYSKDVIQIDGFDVPGSWKDAGLRCLGNVLWRE